MSGVVIGVVIVMKRIDLMKEILVIEKVGRGFSTGRMKIV